MQELGQLELILLSNFHFNLESSSEQKKLTEVQQKIQDKLILAFQQSPYELFLYLAFIKTEISLSASFVFWQKFSKHFIDKLRLTVSLEEMREKQQILVDDVFLAELLFQVPFFQGSEYLNMDCLDFHWSEFVLYFQQTIKKFSGTVEEFLKKYSPDIHLLGKVFFHLTEIKHAEDHFAFMATYSMDFGKNNKVSHKPLQFALTEFESDQDKLIGLLSAVYRAAEKSSFIQNLVDSGELFYPIKFSLPESYQFLQEITLYEDAGILCRIPNWWSSAKKGARVTVSLGDKVNNSLLGLESLVNYQAKIMLGDSELTPEEVKEILNQSEGLAQIKGKWVLVDKEKLEQSLKNWEEANDVMSAKNLSMGDALRLFMASCQGQKSSLFQGTDVEVGLGDWLKDLLQKMRNPQLIKTASPGKSFKAVLRPYQQSGLNWLTLLNSLKFGACLADDMGLGKTIQVLALINFLKDKKEYTPSLLVMPASLIHNWANEIRKHAPEIKYAIAHPSINEINLNGNIDVINQYDLVLTTYGMTKRYVWLKEFKWNYVILDEAQAIKNVNTSQAKAIKSLKSNHRLALTGTPIENRLSDLWSLFDFINPGLLGNMKEFDRMIKSTTNLSGLRQIISPYILRRLKSDKSIIADLPDKIELNSFNALTKTQHVLYQSEVDKLIEALKNVEEGMQRKGLVLSVLMKFKQICNHPDQFLGNSAYHEKDSGKFLRLREICEIIKEKREKVLIFTQFREITSSLSDFLKEVFGQEGLVLHGATSINKRKEMVEQFQSDNYIPFFVLSLKAGGTGLNLTAANHVIHFDRWWNPAVENQATDRAFRIGQTKKVIVHKFVTEGTVEEKIAMMLEEKSALSAEVLADSKESSFITELNDHDLISLFSLSGTRE